MSTRFQRDPVGYALMFALGFAIGLQVMAWSIK